MNRRHFEIMEMYRYNNSNSQSFYFINFGEVRMDNNNYDNFKILSKK